MCDYSAKYYDYEKESDIEYKCPHEPTKPRCMFHDGESFKSMPAVVREEFYNMVKNAITNNESLYCIGFYLPEITVNKKFTKPVYFLGAKFQQANFLLAIFHQQADFSDVIFQQANFSGATFHQQANFLGATFQQAYFLRATFHQQANFSSATFHQQAYFSGADFSEVEFLYVNFPSKYRTNKHLFSWDDKNIINKDIIINALKEVIPTDIDWLHNADLQVKEREITVSNSTHRLSIKLDSDPAKAKSATLEIDNLTYKLIVRRNKNKPDIYTGIPITFAYSKFRSSARFVGKSDDEPLDLSDVSFKGVLLDKVEFHNVKWGEGRVLWFIKRNIVADELIMDVMNNYQEVSRIYDQLRKNYEMHLLFNEASHFFIGEMEAIRKSLYKMGTGGKLSSILYWLYKYIALYGENVFLPLIVWTPAIIIVFAILRILHGGCYEYQCVIEWVTDSIAAYFQVPKNILQQTTWDIIERILAIPILGSAFIALKRRFERRK